MAPSLFAHPFSSYCQKVLIALRESGAAVSCGCCRRRPEHGAELSGAWPLQRFPVLQDGDRTVMEATVIIEYMDLRHPGRVRLTPEDPRRRSRRA